MLRCFFSPSLRYAISADPVVLGLKSLLEDSRNVSDDGSILEIRGVSDDAGDSDAGGWVTTYLMKFTRDGSPGSLFRLLTPFEFPVMIWEAPLMIPGRSLFLIGGPITLMKSTNVSNCFLL